MSLTVATLKNSSRDKMIAAGANMSRDVVFIKRNRPSYNKIVYHNVFV